MSYYLLDTHTFLWFMDGVPRLPFRTRELIEEAEDVCISIASFWEMTIKSSIGRLSLPRSVSETMLFCEDELGFSILAIRDIHLETLRTLPWFHKDPFDRLIIAQAMSENMTLISLDERIMEYPVRRVWEK